MQDQPLRVIFPVVDPHPLAEQALTGVPHERVELRAVEHDAYYRLLCDLWAAGETFLLVEQDIEIHDQVLTQLAACSSPWCLFPYNGPGDPDNLLTRALGCTRFSRELLQAQPSFMLELPVRDWRRLDCEIHPRLSQAGWAVCEHAPPVAHHHVYNGRCACGGGHP